MAGVSIVQSGGTTQVAEGGATALYGCPDAAATTATSRLLPRCDGSVTVDPATLNFTPGIRTCPECHSNYYRHHARSNTAHRTISIQRAVWTRLTTQDCDSLRLCSITDNDDVTSRPCITVVPATQPSMYHHGASGDYLQRGHGPATIASPKYRGARRLSLAGRSPVTSPMMFPTQTATPHRLRRLEAGRHLHGRAFRPPRQFRREQRWSIVPGASPRLRPADRLRGRWPGEGSHLDYVGSNNGLETAQRQPPPAKSARRSASTELGARLVARRRNPCECGPLR